MKRFIAPVAALAVIALAAGCGSSTVSTPAASTSTPDTTAASAPASTEKAKPTMTVAQQQAIESANSYLDMGGFSRARLIQQLSSSAGEGFTHAQAMYAVNQTGL
jgi:hypothetical protein